MAIPSFQEIMLPLLNIAGDGEVHNIHSAARELGNLFNLTDEELEVLIHSGHHKFFNRVGWAKTHLKQAGFLIYPLRGHFQITELGREELNKNPQEINMAYLQQFPQYVEFRNRTRGLSNDDNQEEKIEELTPEEALENAYQKIRGDLSSDLIDYVLKISPSKFEKLVVELLVAMGYGGTLRDAARAVGKSGDEGVDGIIDEDRLGLDTIYLQAKRWQPESKVGRREIQAFVGALHGKRGKRGVFITTSSFTSDAIQFAEGIDIKVVLIDGNKMADLMIDYGVGVATNMVYEIKELDTDYFGELSD